MSTDEGWEEGCSAPPAPSGLALIAAADGEGDDATLAHLQACPHCAERVAQLQLLQARLRRRVYRLFCPDTDTLIDYCQGLIDPHQRAALTHHLAICPYCSDELSLLEHSAPAADVIGYGSFGRVSAPLS